MYLVKTPIALKKMYPRLTWDQHGVDKSLYLTFDDGPTPEVTEWVLEQLEQYNAKATFFCIGRNIENNPAIFKAILKNEHAVGNHTYQHKNGWKTTLESYLEDIVRTEKTIHNTTPSFTKALFRPPYGRIKKKQIKAIKKSGYKIIMWDVLSADFDLNISNKKCLENVVDNVVPGSIVVFHDSIKAKEKLIYTLPKVLEHFSKLGYQFKKLA